MSDVGVVQLTRSIAAFGVPGSRVSGGVHVRDDEWPGLLSDVAAQRLTGLALAAVESEVLQLSGPMIDALVERHRAAMIHALRLEALLLSLADRFDAADVEMIVLKGPALAHGSYADPSWRPFGDLDILVRTRAWRDVGALLAEGGYAPKFPEPRLGFRERFGHTWVHTHETGLELDLHRTLVAGPFGLRMDPDAPFDRATTFRLGGRTLRRLDDQAIFLHACIHALLGHRPPLLLPLRDVVQLLPRSHSDWNAIWELARQWRLEAVVGHAVATAATTLPVDLSPDAESALGQVRESRRERRTIEAYTTARRARGGKTIASVHAIRGAGARAAYVRALLFPDREFLELHEGSRAPLLARWVRPVRWLARR